MQDTADLLSAAAAHLVQQQVAHMPAPAAAVAAVLQCEDTATAGHSILAAAAVGHMIVVVDNNLVGSTPGMLALLAVVGMLLDWGSSMPPAVDQHLEHAVGGMPQHLAAVDSPN